MTTLEHEPRVITPPLAEAIAMPEAREEWLHSLLGTDYEHARPFIDQFAYNPETGQDALRHVLSGNVIDVGDGQKLAMGFHHEPSAGEMTSVDRTHLKADGITAKTRQNYAERPFEPYRAKTTIGGFGKVRAEVTAEGTLTVAPELSTMFPKEYDALTVIKTIVNARDTRDKAKDVVQVNGRIAADGHWFMVDDETMMRMKLILDPKTEQIITAIPHPRSYMNLTPEMINTHLGLS